MSAKLHYDQMTKDLMALTTERVRSALQSVVQVCDTPDQKLCVCLSALTTSAAWAGQAYELRNGLPAGQTDPMELAIALLTVVQEGKL